MSSLMSSSISVKLHLSIFGEALFSLIYDLCVKLTMTVIRQGLLTFMDKSLLSTSWNRMVFSGGEAQSLSTTSRFLKMEISELRMATLSCSPSLTRAALPRCGV